MIAYLKGKIKYIGLNWIILDVNGVGYKIYINAKLQMTNDKQISNSNAPKNKSIIGNWKLEIGNSLEAYIYHHIREDRQELYGFSIMEELQTFELLLSVPGVGPKMSMNILSKTGVDKLKEAISKGDSALLTAISGVGKKLAMKILLELKSKIDAGSLGDFTISEGSAEVIEAMEALGYKKSDIYPIIGKIPSDLQTTQDKMKWILKNIGKRT